MKTLWTSIALMGFVSISLFGLLSITHENGNIAECLASRLNGSVAPCPQSDPLGFANFHSNALKTISNLVFIDSITALYSVAMALILILSSVALLASNKFSLEHIKFSWSERLTSDYSQPIVGLAWLSLHENSPSPI